MCSLNYRLLSLIGSLFIGLSFVVAVSPAAAAVPDIWAFAYNDTLTFSPGWWAINPAYQTGSFKITCSGSTAMINQLSTGRYAVFFPCSASSNGIVHVTAVNEAARYCEIERWYDSGTDKMVIVQCFKGSFADNSRFTVTYTRSSGTVAGKVHAYVWSAPGGVPLSNYNSAGPANTITHLGVGRWEVKIPMSSDGSFKGDLQATAVQESDIACRCHIDNWYISGFDNRVRVSCTNAAGTLIDTYFTLSYHAERAVFGELPSSLSGAAYRTNLPGAPAGTIFGSGGPPTFAPIPPGRYMMHYPGVGIGATHMQVTAFGGPYGYYCQLETIWMISGGNVDARVICFNNVGIPTDNLLFSSFAYHR